MRQNTYTYNVTDTLTVDYPEGAVYTHDRNYIKITATNATGLDVTITAKDNANNTLWTWQYETSRAWVVLDISDRIASIGEQQNVQTSIEYDVNVFHDGTSDNVTDSFTFIIHEGRTISGRAHNHVRCVRYYNGVMGEAQLIQVDTIDGEDIIIDIYCPADLATLPNGEEAFIQSDGGCVVDAFIADAASMYNVIFKNLCVPKNAVWVRFKDTSGCIHTIAGKVMSYAPKGSGVDWFADEVAQKIPCRYASGTELSLTLGIEDVEYGEFLTDILYSDTVAFAYDISADFIPCIADKVDYISDGGRHPMKITLKIQQ